MDFEILGALEGVETIASGRRIRERSRLVKAYGKALWRKKKAVAKIRLSSGRIELAEIHWYEAHGKGRKEMKIKRLIPR